MLHFRGATRQQQLETQVRCREGLQASPQRLVSGPYAGIDAVSSLSIVSAVELAGVAAAGLSANMLFGGAGSPSAYRWPLVRTNKTSSEMAGVAMQMSSIEFLANSSYSFPARTT